MSKTRFEEALEREDWELAAAYILLAATHLMETLPRDSFESLLDLLEAEYPEHPHHRRQRTRRPRQRQSD